MIHGESDGKGGISRGTGDRHVLSALGRAPERIQSSKVAQGGKIGSREEGKK